jgi:BNR repeat-like domain
MTTAGKSLSANFRVVPSDLPNKGRLFVGHGGNCLTECHNGDIVAFYSNVSGEIEIGHGVAGWSEYRRSEDGGKTWGEPVILDYSKRAWEGDDMYAALVFGVATAPNGTLIAFVCRFEKDLWVKKDSPVCLLSHDQGRTWSEPRPLDPDAGVEEVSLTFDAVLTQNDQVFAVFMGGTDCYCYGGPYSLYVSTDNGETFQRRSMLPFSHENYYVTAGVLDNGDLIVYSYSYRRGEDIDEINMPYVTSADQGRTWSEVKTTRFAQGLRNPQFSGKIGNLYFVNGRSGSQDPEDFKEMSGLVLYASSDGVHWDDGTVLYRREINSGDCYSANEVIGKYDPAVPNRLLIQSSVGYEDGSKKVNEHHWWVEEIDGA